MNKVVVLSIILGIGTVGMGAAVPGAPSLPAMGSGGFVMITASNTPGVARSTRGSVMLMAAVRKETDNIKEVVFYVDDKEVGRVNAAPYRMQYDSTALSDGEHTAKFSALDADGKEALSGVVKLKVANDSGPTAAGGGSVPSAAPGLKPIATDPLGRPAPVREKPVVVPPAVKTYSSQKYDIRFDYPSQFTVKDQSSTLGKDWPKGYWLVISSEPVAKSEFVLNVRHKQLQQAHTAESYIKYNPFISTWDRQDTNGKITFLNTAGTPASKRVVHRAIILSGKDVWMLRCIDASGKPADESKAAFLNVVASMDYVKNPTGVARPDAGQVTGDLPPVAPPVAPAAEVSPAPVDENSGSAADSGTGTESGDTDAPPPAPESGE